MDEYTIKNLATEHDISVNLLGISNSDIKDAIDKLNGIDKSVHEIKERVEEVCPEYHK